MKTHHLFQIRVHSRALTINAATTHQSPRTAAIAAPRVPTGTIPAREFPQIVTWGRTLTESALAQPLDAATAAPPPSLWAWAPSSRPPWSPSSSRSSHTAVQIRFFFIAQHLTTSKLALSPSEVLYKASLHSLNQCNETCKIVQKCKNSLPLLLMHNDRFRFAQSGVWRSDYYMKLASFSAGIKSL